MARWNRHITEGGLRKFLIGLMVIITAASLWATASVHAADLCGCYVAGRETFSGLPLKHGEGRMGVRFRGWFVANAGWQDVAHGDGTVLVVIDYTGVPAWGGSINLSGGSWRAWIPNLGLRTGEITGGAVVWPSDSQADLGCGAGIATVSGALSGHFKRFVGCLDDAPNPTPLIPMIWGRFFTD